MLNLFVLVCMRGSYAHQKNIFCFFLIEIVLIAVYKKATAITTLLWYSVYLVPLLHPDQAPSLSHWCTPIPNSLFWRVHPVPTSVCVPVSVSPQGEAPLSQPLGALLTPQHSVFAQSFGSRIRG